MKPLTLASIAMIATAGLLLGTASSAQAATNVKISVTADAYAIDDSGQITGSNEFLYDSAKGDEPGNAYQIAYRGNLNMKELWQSYDLFKGIYTSPILYPGNAQKWPGKTFSGEWKISFKVDTEVVTADLRYFDRVKIQEEIERQNQYGGQTALIAKFIRCESVNYDESTGVYTADFKLINEDGSKVTGEQLDQARGQTELLHLTTPPQAFYVRQSEFVAGKTFDLTDSRVRGEMTMDAFFNPILPLTFDAEGRPVTLTMVDTYDSTYEFVSNTPGRQLSADVQALLPPTTTMLRDGATVQPPAPSLSSVADTQGTWTFVGWKPNQATIDGESVHFVGEWEFAVAPDAQFNVNYRFVDIAGKPVPPQVAGVKPLPGTATQGDTVHAAAFPANDIQTSAGTWSFVGWQDNPIVVDGLDIEFVGVWSFSKSVVPPIDGGSGGLANSGAEPQSLLLGAGMLALLAGGLVLVARIRAVQRR